jgi:hypothetical protein
MIHALKKYDVLRDIVDRCNAVVVERIKDNQLREANIALESFNNGGKRLRPILLVLSAKAPDGGPLNDIDECLVQLAGAVELVHLATLFHDDVIDQVDTRRAKLSARLKYGNYASVLAGDFALAEALDLVHRSGVHAAMPEFIRTLRTLVRGESLETTHKFDFTLNDAQYYEIISEKSASYLLSRAGRGPASRTGFADALGTDEPGHGVPDDRRADDMLDNPSALRLRPAQQLHRATHDSCWTLKTATASGWWPSSKRAISNPNTSASSWGCAWSTVRSRRPTRPSIATSIARPTRCHASRPHRLRTCWPAW